MKTEVCMIWIAKETDLEWVNELRRQVNTVHVEGRPNIFKPGFCREMQVVAGEILQSEDEAAGFHTFRRFMECKCE